MMQRVIYLGRGAALPAWGVGLLGQIDLASRRCSAARMGGGTCLVTRHFCAKLAVQAFCSSPPGGIPCHPPRPLLALIPPLLAGYAVKGPVASLPFAVLTLDGASLRGSFALRGWLRGNDNSRGFI